MSKCSAGDAVTITLDKEIDISRGDLLYKNSPGLKKIKHSFLVLYGSQTKNVFQIDLIYLKPLII